MQNRQWNWLPSSPNFRLSNFLSDKATQPYMAMIDLCAAFGVGQSTAGGKARVVRPLCIRTAWLLPSIVDQVWMAEVNGLLVDLRESRERSRRSRSRRA